jgi:hypothetical protein
MLHGLSILFSNLIFVSLLDNGSVTFTSAVEFACVLMSYEHLNYQFELSYFYFELLNCQFMSLCSNI